MLAVVLRPSSPTIAPSSASFLNATVGLTKHLSKNENQNHAHEQTRLLCGTTHTRITDDTDGETGSETREADGETGAELDEAGEEGQLLRQVVGDQDADDKAVDGDDTSHDDWNDVCDSIECQRPGAMVWE